MTGRAILIAALAVALGACASAGGGESPPPHVGTAPAPRSEPPATASVPHPPTSRSPRGSPRSRAAPLARALGDRGMGPRRRTLGPPPRGRPLLRSRFQSQAGRERDGSRAAGPRLHVADERLRTAPVGRGGVLDGDLVLYGRGDPNLSGRFAPSVTAIFEALADSLAARPAARDRRAPRRREPVGRRLRARRLGELRPPLVVRGAGRRARIQRQLDRRPHPSRRAGRRPAARHRGAGVLVLHDREPGRDRPRRRAEDVRPDARARDEPRRRLRHAAARRRTRRRVLRGRRSRPLGGDRVRRGARAAGHRDRRPRADDLARRRLARRGRRHGRAGRTSASRWRRSWTPSSAAARTGTPSSFSRRSGARSRARARGTRARRRTPHASPGSASTRPRSSSATPPPSRARTS